MRKITLMLTGLLCITTLLLAKTVIGQGETVVVVGEMQGSYQLNGGELIIRDVPADLGKIELNSGILRVNYGFSIRDENDEESFPLRIEPGVTVDMGMWDLTDTGLDTVAILAGGALSMRWCIIAAEQIAICSEETSAPIIVEGCYFGRSQQASIQLFDGDLQIDSCRFVTNNVVVQVYNDAQVQIQDCQFIESSQAIAVYSDSASVEVQNCDFIGSRLHDVNCQTGTVILSECYRDGAADLVGDVIENDPQPDQLGDDPPDPKSASPDAIGPDQLEWVEVTKTIEDRPIRVVEYKVYRSDDPYAVFAPENLLTITSQTLYNDPGHGGMESAFYRIVAVSGP